MTTRTHVRLCKKTIAGILAVIAFALILLVTPIMVYASSTTNNNAQSTNPDWQNMTDAERWDWLLNWAYQTNPNWRSMNDTQQWNWLHNYAYQAPTYRFETTFPVNQWGRPTTSNVAPQHTQNIRRDRHAAFLPPAHGSQTGFFSGEFSTNQLNPFAPRYNNNPNASHAVWLEESVFALLPGEAGVNVHADGSQSGGFLASTSVTQGGGNSGSSAPHGGPVSDTTPPWNSPSEQSHGGVTITHTPMQPMQGAGSSQSGNQTNRITTITPFDDGTIGRIAIPALNRTALVRPGLVMSTLDYYVGHFSNTSQWDGNVALASHNRGRGSFFAGIWTLQIGDRIMYETTMGVRIYEVVSVSQIAETDLSNLDHTHENTLTLVTCVYGQPALRWSVRAREVV